MKRREFIQNIAALAATPALPVKLLAGSLPVSAAIYAKAVHYAKLWDTSVPEMYTSALGLGHDDAFSVFDKLVEDGVIGAPNSVGMGRAVLPYFKDPMMARKIANVLRKPGTPPITGKPQGMKTRSAGKLQEKLVEAVQVEEAPQELDQSDTDQKEQS
jgi:hypothetical protein